MEVRAKLRGVRFTPQKGRLVAGLIREKSASRALEILQGCEKSAAGPIEKLLRSALANAVEHNSRHQAGIDLDNLYVKTIVVDEGPRSWRIRPRAQGRATWIKKGTSHVTVVLDER
jgi:large subunit ribosomal protein L22